MSTALGIIEHWDRYGASSRSLGICHLGTVIEIGMCCGIWSKENLRSMSHVQMWVYFFLFLLGTWWEEEWKRGQGIRAATKTLASIYQLFSGHCMSSVEIARKFCKVYLSVQPTWRKHDQAAEWWFSSSLSYWQHCRWWLHGTGRGNSRCCLKKRGGIGSEQAARNQTCRIQRGCTRQLLRKIYDLSNVNIMLWVCVK